MNLNNIYLAAVAANSSVVAVEVYFRENAAVAPTSAPAPTTAPATPNRVSAARFEMPEAPWAMDAASASAEDLKRRPVKTASKPVDSSRSVFTYLAPKSYDLKADDAVIVVNDVTGKVSIAYVHAVVGIDLDKLNAVAATFGYQHADGHFWKWIVSPVNFDQYNDLNKARETFLAKAANVESTKRANEMRQQLVELYGSASAVNDLFDSVLPGVEPDVE